MTGSAISLDALSFHGRGLKRPECVVAHASGLLFTADWTGDGGVAAVDPATDAVHRLEARSRVRPNGILPEDGGTFLIAHLDDAQGGVFRLHPDGRVEPVLTQIDGHPLPPTNFVAKDGEGRLYVTVSTRHVPRHLAAHESARDGFVALVDPGGRARIVADGLGYTNECVLDPASAFLYVNETFGRATSRFPVRADGTLGAREEIARYGEGIFPDGLVLDAEGGIWVTSIISNIVLRIAPDGTRAIVVEDCDTRLVAAVEHAYQRHALDRALLDTPHEGRLKNVSSLAFGGADLATAYLGCLLGDTIASFPSPVPGARPAHFDADITPLVDAGVLPKLYASAR